MQQQNDGASIGAPDALAGFAPIAHQIIHALPVAVATFDQHLDIIDANPPAQKLLASADNLAQALSQAGADPGEPDWHQQLTEVITQVKSVSYDNVPYSLAGRRRCLHITCAPLTAPTGDNGARAVALIEDVTDKVMMHRDLASAERLAAVGKLAARVAHELNNPLDGILRYINLALRVAQQDGLEQLDHYLHQSRRGVQRMVQIISELLEFSRSTYSAAAEAELNKIVEEAVKAMEGQATDQQVEIRREYSGAMPNIRSGNLFQVFCNLIKNAVDAMAGHCQAGAARQLAIRTFCDEHDAVIEFCDTGPGLSAEVQEKLFEPFFTTKPASKGTGLGLAICQDIVERYGGQIKGENRPEGGSRFTVRLPLERTSYGESDRADKQGT